MLKKSTLAPVLCAAGGDCDAAHARALAPAAKVPCATTGHAVKACARIAQTL